VADFRKVRGVFRLVVPSLRPGRRGFSICAWIITRRRLPQPLRKNRAISGKEASRSSRSVRRLMTQVCCCRKSYAPPMARPATAYKDRVATVDGLERLCDDRLPARLISFHCCPVKSRTESVGCGMAVTHLGNRNSEVPVKWGFSRKE
jgi:hypothetical protein